MPSRGSRHKPKWYDGRHTHRHRHRDTDTQTPNNATTNTTHTHTDPNPDRTPKTFLYLIKLVRLVLPLLVDIHLSHLVHRSFCARTPAATTSLERLDGTEGIVAARIDLLRPPLSDPTPSHRSYRCPAHCAASSRRAARNPRHTRPNLQRRRLLRNILVDNEYRQATTFSVRVGPGHYAPRMPASSRRYVSHSLLSTFSTMFESCTKQTLLR